MLLQIKHKLTFCLNRVIPELYQGPWKTDPASFSYALDKYQYETDCCAADSYKVYQTFVGWNKTHWNTPLKHFDGYNQGASQQNPAAARKPILLIPWTCCKFRKDKKKPKYDPGLSLKELEASLVDPSCTYRVTTTSVNLLPCSPSIQDQLKQISFVFILVVDTLLFCNIVRCMIGIYGAKAYRYQKNK
ncbi:hypothetical protein BaRGS_00020437 [Batillaria attramentaria]|uniref:Uncharacterized protein n=1 Tax=Batillaria attramentaria TaxID=370345 RepID=A0ABD0KN09_9CAEN